MSEAVSIARALGGKRSGRGWVCRCPSHNDHSPSLWVREAVGGNGVSLVCFAGCDRAVVPEAIRATQEFAALCSPGAHIMLKMLKQL